MNKTCDEYLQPPFFGIVIATTAIIVDTEYLVQIQI